MTHSFATRSDSSVIIVRLEQTNKTSPMRLVPMCVTLTPRRRHSFLLIHLPSRTPQLISMACRVVLEVPGTWRIRFGLTGVANCLNLSSKTNDERRSRILLVHPIPIILQRWFRDRSYFLNVSSMLNICGEHWPMLSSLPIQSLLGFSMPSTNVALSSCYQYVY